MDYVKKTSLFNFSEHKPEFITLISEIINSIDFLCHRLLPKWFIKGIDDTLQRCKCLEYFLEETHQSLFESLRIIRQLRNRLHHGKFIDYFMLFDVDESIRQLQNYCLPLFDEVSNDRLINQSARFSELLIMVSPEHVVCRPLVIPQIITTQSSVIPEGLIEDTLLNLRNYYRDPIKGARFSVSTGKHFGRSGTFISWNGNNCLVQFDDCEKLSGIPLDTSITVHFEQSLNGSSQV